MRHKRRIWVEWGQNALIALLSLSAIYLSFQTLVYSLTPDRNSLWEEMTGLLQPGSSAQPVSGPSALAELTRPVRIAVTTPDGRYGVHYDTAAVDAVYEDTASLLAECLLRAGTPARVSSAQWRQALERTGIYYDFLGELPLSVLSAGLSQTGGGSALTQSARHVLLTDDGEGGMLLWFWDVKEDAPYRCPTSSVLQGQLEETAARYLPNNATFAFQSSGQYGQLADSQLFTSESPVLPVYAASDPLAADASLLENLLRTVGINPHALYTSSDGDRVARDGNYTIRVSPSGTVRFSTGPEEGTPRLPVSAMGETPTAVEAVEAAWSLLSATLTPTLGDARLYLLSCEPNATGSWTILFGYALSGAQVELAEFDYAVGIYIEGRRISDIFMHYRTYTAADSESVLLPEPQAVAALLALDGAEKELLAAYLDAEEALVQASWIGR